MPDDHPDILIYPPIAFAIAVIASYGLYLLVPVGFPVPLGLWIGLVLFAIAFAVGAAGAGLFLRIGTPISPHKSPEKLVTAGIYKFTRNPMYLALTLTLFSLALIFSNTWAAFATPILWGVLHYGVVLPEERFLLRKFGEDYAELLSSTRRWI
ncbi:MAG: isoprenylcysteine carboxylmethyltransferase family protein [Pseudomonadota bacterium]